MSLKIKILLAVVALIVIYIIIRKATRATSSQVSELLKKAGENGYGFASLEGASGALKRMTKAQVSKMTEYSSKPRSELLSFENSELEKLVTVLKSKI